MVSLKPVIKFDKFKDFFNDRRLLGKVFVLFTKMLADFLENSLGRDLYFDVSKIENSAGLSAKNQKLLFFLKECGIVKEFGPRPHFPDEPRYFSFSAKTKSFGAKSDGDWCGGESLMDPDEAVIKAAAEALERHSLYVWERENFIFDSYNNLKQAAVDPSSFAGIGEAQKQSVQFKNFGINRESILGWTKARDLMNGKETFISAQLVYLTYNLQEPRIYLTNTTGAAAGASFEEAAYRGLCEAIERDAWMITYYNRLSPPVIDLSDISKLKNSELIKLLNSFRRYNLRPIAVDMTTDIKIPTILGIVIDKNSRAKIAVGAKTTLDFEEAILGAILEAQKVRVAVRRMFDKKEVNKNDLLYRAYFWNLPGKMKDLAFLWQGHKKEISNSKSQITNSPQIPNSKHDYKTKLAAVLEELKEKGCNAYVKDVTTLEAKKLSFCVVKTLVPQLQPMHLSESCPFLGGERLYNVPVRLGYFDRPKTFEELSQMPPHPFA